MLYYIFYSLLNTVYYNIILYDYILYDIVLHCIMLSILYILYNVSYIIELYTI